MTRGFSRVLLGSAFALALSGVAFAQSASSGNGLWAGSADNAAGLSAGSPFSGGTMTRQGATRTGATMRSRQPGGQTQMGWRACTIDEGYGRLTPCTSAQ